MADYRVLYTTLYFLFCFLRGSTIYYLVGYTILTHRLLEICLVSLNKNESSNMCINTLERLDPKLQLNQFKHYVKQLECRKLT